MWLKSKNIPLGIKIIPVNRRQRVVFLYFELTCSQQMCLVVTSFKQAKPWLECLEVAGPWFGGIRLVGAKFLYDPWRSLAPRVEVSWWGWCWICWQSKALKKSRPCPQRGRASWAGLCPHHIHCFFIEVAPKIPNLRGYPDFGLILLICPNSERTSGSPRTSGC